VSLAVKSTKIISFVRRVTDSAACTCVAPSVPLSPFRVISVFCIFYAAPLLYPAPLFAQSSQSFDADTAQRFVDQYCAKCHNAEDWAGSLDLGLLNLTEVPHDAATWEKVLGKLRGSMMPPQGNERPSPTEQSALTQWLEASLDAAASAAPNPGRASLHRLNRTEYGNSVRDLLGLEVDIRDYLPADDEGYGFDNIADVLRASPSLLEQYLGASRKIAALAVGDMAIEPVSQVYKVPPDAPQAQHLPGLPLGTRGGILIEHDFPLDAEYEFHNFLTRNIVGYMTGLEWPHQFEISIDGARVFLAQVGGEEDNAQSDANFAAAADVIDARLKTRIPVRAGRHQVAVTFLQKNAAESHEPLELFTRDLDLQNMNGVPTLDYVDIVGPYAATGPGNTASRRRIFSCYPEQQADALPCAQEILGRLGRLAYRRPLTDEDRALLLDFFRAGNAQGGFEAGIQHALRFVLTSPYFLFRSEPDPDSVAPGEVYALDDVALASRLSFFLWSSLPDDTLLQLAEANQLHEPQVLRQQVQRMLADAKADALVDNFAAQWLFLRNLQSINPDTRTFPMFDDKLRAAFRSETTLFLRHIMRQDRPIPELLTADYTFVNDRLAAHYGIPNVYGSHFRKVQQPDPNRRGLLGQGSVLTVTSYPNRTSPVLRGKWVLENVIGAPVPAPPPNVPALDENAPGATALSVRERLEQHRADPVCSGCHSVMDPLGFSLEHFDAIGRYRERDASGAIDSAGQLADGSPIDGALDLERALMLHPEYFVDTFTEKLLTYALGRGLESFDMPVVRSITRAAAAENYQFSAIVAGIVQSVPFRLKRAVEAETPTLSTAQLAPTGNATD